ncbi:pyridoxamine 5'-phosphate oxidase, partial [Acidobacteria bacterium AH-259-A15]|nr:pyridoxamine 5'-phosphate oxidase [Acidobacteria bacterium AH-259-A15]
MKHESPTKASPALRKKNADPNPFKQFDRWFQEAGMTIPILPEAMALATVDKDGKPSVRTVLLKHFDEWGFVFYTNYESRKGKELAENPNAALIFYWGELRRQICVTGTVSKASGEESKAYFRTRDRGSQIAALASNQSQVISSRKMLEDRFEQLAAECEGKEVPLPSNWGGYRLSPTTIEFWQNRPDRL